MIEWSEFPTCPYCGEVDREWWDSCDGEEEWETTCGACEEDYRVTLHTTHRFDTCGTKEDTGFRERARPREWWKYYSNDLVMARPMDLQFIQEELDTTDEYFPAVFISAFFTPYLVSFLNPIINEDGTDEAASESIRLPTVEERERYGFAPTKVNLKANNAYLLYNTETGMYYTAEDWADLQWEQQKKIEALKGGNNKKE